MSTRGRRENKDCEAEPVSKLPERYAWVVSMAYGICLHPRGLFDSKKAAEQALRDRGFHCSSGEWYNRETQAWAACDKVYFDPETLAV